jgi:hypothetical protein
MERWQRGLNRRFCHRHPAASIEKSNVQIPKSPAKPTQAGSDF